MMFAPVSARTMMEQTEPAVPQKLFVNEAYCGTFDESQNFDPDSHQISSGQSVPHADTSQIKHEVMDMCEEIAPISSAGNITQSRLSMGDIEDGKRGVNHASATLVYDCIENTVVKLELEEEDSLDDGCGVDKQFQQTNDSWSSGFVPCDLGDDRNGAGTSGGQAYRSSLAHPMETRPDGHRFDWNNTDDIEVKMEPVGNNMDEHESLPQTPFVVSSGDSSESMPAVGELKTELKTVPGPFSLFAPHGQASSDSLKSLAMTEKRPRMSLCVREKQEISYFHFVSPKKSHQEIADHFSTLWGKPIKRRTVGDILQRKDTWMAANLSNSNLATTKKMRKAKHHTLEKAVFLWFVSARANNSRITEKCLRNKAMEFGSGLNITGFNYSSGWLTRFKQRYGLTQHCTTTTNGEEVCLVEPDSCAVSDDDVTVISGSPQRTEEEKGVGTTDLVSASEVKGTDDSSKRSKPVLASRGSEFVSGSKRSEYVLASKGSECVLTSKGSERVLASTGSECVLASTGSERVLASKRSKCVSASKGSEPVLALRESDPVLVTPTSLEARDALQTLHRYFQASSHSTKHDISLVNKLHSRIDTISQTISSQPMSKVYFSEIR